MYEAHPILIILAGGKSSRMGVPKGLLDFNGDPWLVEQLSRCKSWPNGKVYIGLGYDVAAYFDAMPWLKEAQHEAYTFKNLQVRVCLNSQPELGPFSTFLGVLKQIEEEAPVAVLPIDVPMLNRTALSTLIKQKNRVVIPQFQGKSGHPVLLRSEFWKPLLQLDSKDPAARLDRQIKLLPSHKISHIALDDAALTLNLNTPEDWSSYQNSFT